MTGRVGRCLLLASIVLARLALAQAGACADTTRAILADFVGEWRVSASFRADSGRWENDSARATISPDMGGCVLSEHFYGRRYGAPYEFLATWGANGGSPRIQRSFVHSQHGLIGVMGGDFVGDTLVLGDSAVVRGQLVLEQHVFSRPVRSGFFFESRRSADRGRTWIATWRATYRRLR